MMSGLRPYQAWPLLLFVFFLAPHAEQKAEAQGVVMGWKCRRCGAQGVGARPSRCPNCQKGGFGNIPWGYVLGGLGMLAVVGLIVGGIKLFAKLKDDADARRVRRAQAKRRRKEMDRKYGSAEDDDEPPRRRPRDAEEDDLPPRRARAEEAPPRRRPPEEDDDDIPRRRPRSDDEPPRRRPRGDDEPPRRRPPDEDEPPRRRPLRRPPPD